MILVLRDGRRIAPAVMGRIPGDDETERRQSIDIKGYEISDNRDLFGHPLLVTVSLNEVVDIEGSYMFPPIDFIEKKN